MGKTTVFGQGLGCMPIKKHFTLPQPKFFFPRWKDKAYACSIKDYFLYENFYRIFFFQVKTVTRVSTIATRKNFERKQNIFLAIPNKMIDLVWIKWNVIIILWTGRIDFEREIHNRRICFLSLEVEIYDLCFLIQKSLKYEKNCHIFLWWNIFTIIMHHAVM